jgi:hypothetical protein
MCLGLTKILVDRRRLVVWWNVIDVLRIVCRIPSAFKASHARKQSSSKSLRSEHQICRKWELAWKHLLYKQEPVSVCTMLWDIYSPRFLIRCMQYILWCGLHICQLPATENGHVQVTAMYRSLPCTGHCHVQVTAMYRSLPCTGHGHVQVTAMYRSLPCTGHCHIQVTAMYRSLPCTGHCHVEVTAMYRSNFKNTLSLRCSLNTVQSLRSVTFCCTKLLSVVVWYIYIIENVLQLRSYTLLGSRSDAAEHHTLVHQYTSTTVHQYNSTPVQQYASTTVQQHTSATVNQYNSTSVQQYNSTPVQQYNSTPVQQ